MPGWTAGEELGRGAFSRVLRAQRDRDGVPGALKVATPGDRLARLQLGAEARALKQVGPPAVPELLGEGAFDDGTPWLLLELIDWPTMEKLLAASQPPLEALAALGLSLIGAVERLHGAGVLHLDLKPANVFARLQPAEVRLFDLGLSRTLAGRAAAVELEAAGTPAYLAPEQCDGRPLTTKTDLYSLGVLLFELLAGAPPFSGAPGEIRQAHLSLRPPRPSRLRGQPVPVGLEEVALRCLAKDPAERFESAAAVRKAWEAAMPAPWAPVSWPPPAAPVAPLSRAPSPPAQRRTAGLVFFNTTLTPLAIAAEVQTAGARLGHAAPPRFVAVVAPERSEHAVREALAVAQALCGRRLTEAAVVDVGPVAVQSRPGGTLRYVSSAFGRSECFPAVGDPPGPMLSAEAALLLPELPTAPAGRDDLRCLVTAPESDRSPATVPLRTPLFGRDGLLDALCTEAARAIDAAEPCCAVLISDAGFGRTRLAAALSERLRRQLPSAEVLDLRAPEPLISGGGDGLLRLLLERLLDAPREHPPMLMATPTRVEPGREPGDLAQLRERLRERLAELPVEVREPGSGRLFFALALVLGLVGPEHAEVRALAAAPGAVRALQLRGVGELLRARARRQPLCLQLDDGHHAGDTALDALEYATLAEARVPLFCAVFARPAFSAARPSFGERAARSRLDKLSALDPEQAAALCRALLEPAVNVPAEAVERLVQRAQGVPLLLVELVRGLQREGLVQRRGHDSWVLATDELDRLPALPLVEWLAERELGALPPDLKAHAQLVALLGPEVRQSEVVGVMEELDRDGAVSAALPLDAQVGLRRLRAAGLLVSTQGGMLRLRHSLVRDAVVKGAPAALRRAVHQAAHRYYQTARGAAAVPEVRRLPLLALHAAESGLFDEAAGRYLELAQRARVRHAYLEAERCCSRALELLGAQDAPRRMLALHARAAMRYRIGRSEDALADFAAARLLARETSDGDALVELLLEEATALDWRNEFARSAALVEEATIVAEVFQDKSALRSARLSLGAGRSLFRQTEWSRAADELEQAAQLAAGCGDAGYETRVIALTCLQVILPQLGRVAETERISQEVIALCRLHGDQLHLGSAINNRRNLLVARKDLAACVADQQVFMRIGRELGMALHEYYGEFNLSETLFTAGDAAGARLHAERALEIEQRHPEVAPRRLLSLLLRARIDAWTGRPAEARAARERVLEAAALETSAGRAAFALLPSDLVLESLVDLATRPSTPAEWDALEARSKRDSVEQEHLEVLDLRAWTLLRAGRDDEAAAALARARVEALRIPNLFDARLERLATALGAPGAAAQA